MEHKTGWNKEFQIYELSRFKNEVIIISFKLISPRCAFFSSKIEEAMLQKELQDNAPCKKPFELVTAILQQQPALQPAR